MKNKGISFEAEFIAVDEKNIPVNEFNGEQTSNYIINYIKNKYGKKIIQGLIGVELDSSQIEIRNSGPKYYLSEAQEELFKLYEMVYDAVYNEMGLKLLDGSVPNQNYEPIFTKGIEKYETIDSKLREIGLDYRKATNVGGIHFHIDTDNEFDSHIKLSSEISKIYKNNSEDLLLGNERHKMIQKVVSGLKKLGFLDNKNIVSSLEPIDLYMVLNNSKENINNILLDENKNPRFSYNYVGLKKPGKNFTTEIRSIDGVGKIDDLIINTTKIYNLVNDILK